MGNLKKQTFPVLNMHCAGCANNVEKTVRKLMGRCRCFGQLCFQYTVCLL